MMGAAEFGAAIGQDTIDTQAMPIKEGYHPIIQQIGSQGNRLKLAGIPKFIAR